MSRQTRPFVVEVKQKRGNSKQGRSIWGDLDLSAIVAETRRDSEDLELPNRELIDSKVTPIDAEDGYKRRAEHLMADLKEAESPQTSGEAVGETPVTQKKAPRPKTAKAQSKPSPRKAVGPAPAVTDTPAATRRKIYSEKERSQLLGQIEKVAGRGESIRSAVKRAGISEQTYYQWKKSAVPASTNSDLKDLLALEEENVRLKKLLAERLREENAELKKRLGLD